MNRINSIDTARGVVMIIMALDHVRDFLHITSVSQDPTNLQTTTAVIFLTRWITHLCAPTFVLLSGISAYLYFRKNCNLADSRRFFFTRGVWLVILEFTVVNFALWYDIRFRLLLMEVISAIGISFIIISLILRMPSRIIGLTGIIIVFTHNMLQSIIPPEQPVFSLLSSVLLKPGLLQFSQETAVFTAYPVVPWLGIFLAGFGIGEIFEMKQPGRKKFFLTAGFSMLLLFIVLRFLNSYGDPVKWEVQKSALFTFLSFINVTKYPPSLLFSLLFTGLALIILYFSETGWTWLMEFFSVYGRVPLFYFIIHLYLIHGLMFAILYLQGFTNKDFIFGAFKNGRPEAFNGVDTGIVYLIWLGVVLFLYPLCRWYGDYKSANRHKRYLKYL